MMNCVAVDDEHLALDLLEDNIKRVPFLNLAARCKNAFEANEVLLKEKIDLLFLDVQMPGISGIQFLQSVKTPPLVIFITAYEKFALEGFNLDAVDYLLKPVSFDRFLKAVTKAYEFFNLKQGGPPAATTPISSPVEYLFVNAEYNLVKITLKDILYIEGLKDYVKIFTSTAQRPIITRMSMKNLEEKLPANAFSRVHKSYIVSIDKIISIRRGKISVGTVHIPISEHYKDNLNRFIDPGSLGMKTES
jgi:DNA-binding LytR/AlgR family response regulator